MKQLPLFLYLIVLVGISGCSTAGDWRTASRASAGIAPSPEQHHEAIIHVYGADAWGWRGWFAIHTWIAAKRSGDSEYRVYDVVGWRQYRGNTVVAAINDVPDRYWFGARPELLLELRGDGVDELIDKVEAAVEAYPWKNEYSAFPGPNSNTFVAWVGRQVPELELELPFSAIGSGYVRRSEQSVFSLQQGEQ